ncbi:MAG: T9SS type A sorting domain-containing protein [Flavobacteriia bacterium]|jgi:hypothetical protein
MNRKLLTVLIFASGSLLSFGQEEIENNEITYRHGKFLGESIPLKNLPTAKDTEESEHYEGEIKEHRKRPEAVNAEALPAGKDPIVQESFGMTPSRAPIKNWDGQTGAFPPDPSGAAGPNHYVQAVNTKYRVYDKNGTALTNSLNLSSLWAGSTNDGDPIVMYDRHADRWVITQFQVSSREILFAVSTTPDPTGTYFTYSYTFTQFPDYPKYSIWADGYYMTSNSSSKNAVAFDRTKMLAGDPSASMIALNTPGFTTQYGFKSVLPADADGTLPPFGTPQYLFYFQDDAWNNVSADVIKILKMQVDWNTPTNSTISLHQTLYPSAFNAVFTNTWDDITQKNTTQKLDAIASVFNYRAQYMRWSGGYNSVVLCNVVDVDGANRAGIRWYELHQQEATSQFSIFQEGTYAPADGASRFIGSIAMDNQKHIGLAYCISGPNIFPSIGYTGRYSWFAPGDMGLQETIAVTGLSSQTGGNRYGDYSHMSLDPDGKTFWFTGEYLGSAGSRKTRIFSFSLQDILETPQNALDQSEMKVYQNGSELNVAINSLEKEGAYVIELFDLSGRTISSMTTSPVNGSMSHIFNVSALPKAAYIVRVGNSGIQRTQKIVLQ